MDTLIENVPIYVVRMSRLEAARTLADPHDLQVQLRALLRPDSETGGAIEGKVVVPALTAGRNGHGEPATPLVRKKMKQLHASGRRVKCPYCDKPTIKRGLNVHIAHMHPDQARVDPWPKHASAPAEQPAAE